MKFNIDCRYYVGEKPCKYNRLCDECPHYDKFGTKILIIKLGAMGDVIRTTPVLPLIAMQYQKRHITWCVDPESALFLQGNPYIDRVIPFGVESSLRLMVEQFDIVYCFDKEIRATALAAIVGADRKIGFGLDRSGNIYPFNASAEYSLALGMSDQLKFYENNKTYQRELLDTAGFADSPYGEYIIPSDNFELDYGVRFIERYNILKRSLIVGINTGAGERFATKRYDEAHFVSLIKRIVETMDATVFLLGGPSETERNRRIMRLTAGLTHVVDTGCNNTLRQFVGLLNVCDVVVTGDTLALHLAIAVKTRVVALFGSTCHQEIDLYGLGEKLAANAECAPCYKRECPLSGGKYMQCMKQISPQAILEAVQRQVKFCIKDTSADVTD
ncbi:MAG: glycosyltransferase family 9 protein [Candidatus Auribacterota bacterium]|jgi:heptosyltransferase-2|nr:glycosyltransferase family 9 protein [Candidatus Auribacterota bacterium]